MGCADDHGGYAGDGDVGWYVFHDDAAGTDLGAFADLNITDNRRVRADQNAAANFRVAIAGVFARTPERDAMEYGDVIFDDGGFADHQSGSMVKHDATADLGGGVDIHGKNTA